MGDVGSLLEHWTEYGYPNDPQTLQTATRIVLPALWKEYRRLVASMTELTVILEAKLDELDR